MGGIARATITGWLSDAFKAAHLDGVEALVARMAAMPVAGFAGNTRVLRDVDLRDRLAAIAAPTLVIGGAEDGLGGAAAPMMAEGVRNGRLVTIPNAAHLSHLEHPAAFAAAVTGLFASA